MRHLTLALALAGCGTAPPTATISPGTYAVEATIVADPCKVAEKPQFADVTVTPSAIEIGLLGRRFDLAERGGVWVAGGNVPADCPVDMDYELFVLEPAPGGGFVGSFETMFRLPDACTQTCLVRAQIVGTPGATPSTKKVHGSFVGSSVKVMRAPLAVLPSAGGPPPNAPGLFGQPAPGDPVDPSRGGFVPRGAAPPVVGVPGAPGGPPLAPGTQVPPGLPGGPPPPPPGGAPEGPPPTP